MGGWQRLWVVLSVVTAIAVFAERYQSFPTAESTRSWLLTRASIWLRCDQFYEDIAAGIKNTATECRAYPKELVRENLTRELKRYQQDLNSLPDSQKWYVARGVGTWLSVSIALYLCGYAIGWIGRGFRLQRER